MFRLLVLVFLLAQAGCSTHSSIYNPSNLAEDKLATVTCEKAKWFSSRVTPFILGIYTENDGEITEAIGTSYWGTAQHLEVKLQPGKYLFNVICDNGQNYAYPRGVQSVETGRDYLLTCKSTTKKGPFGGKALDKVGIEFHQVKE